MKWPIDLEGGLDKRLHETFGLTNSDEINIRQGIVIINKIFDIQIFILGQITELKENIRVIQEEYDEAKKNIENIYLEPRNSNKFDYIKSISQKLNILSEDKAVTTKNGLYNIIKPILSIKQKLIFEGINNKKSISKYLQILRNKIINSILNEYFKILKNEFKNELNKYFEIPNKVSEQDVTSIENNLLILIPKD